MTPSPEHPAARVPTGPPLRVLTVDVAVAEARDLASAGGRRLLGICGPPGSGKSTLAARVVGELGGRARLVPMDGFHLAQVELARLGRENRKGAIETFDALGYVALLRRLHEATEEVVYAPEFRREIEEPVAGAIAVPAGVPLVVTEGNYLLADEPPWDELRSLLDTIWYVDTPDDTRLRRLIERHIRYGRDPEAARAWALGTDQRNAVLVASTMSRAEALVRLPA